MGSDPEQEYLSDGITEDIIIALSHVPWLFVIARNSSFVYKNQSIDARTIGRALGVRYLLEGSVRRVGARVRVTGQLIDAITGNHIWADRFGGTIDDIFDLQDRITEHVIARIVPELRSTEIERARSKRL